MKVHTADILILHESAITVVFDTNSGRWAMPTSTYNWRLNWHILFEKRQLRPVSAYNVWTVRASEKCSIIGNRKSTRAFQRAIHKVRTLPLTPPISNSRSKFVVLRIKFNFNGIKSNIGSTFRHNTRVWQTDRQTDGETKRQTDGETELRSSIPR